MKDTTCLLVDLLGNLQHVVNYMSLSVEDDRWDDYSFHNYGSPSASVKSVSWKSEKIIPKTKIAGLRAY